MNNLTLGGRLAKDPELRTTKTGKSVCTFTVAVNRKFKQEGQPTADFFDVVAWGKLGETIKQYLSKGREIFLRGQMQQVSYQAKDGGTRYKYQVLLDEFDFVGGGNATVASAQNNKPSFDLDDEDFHLIDMDDDVPF